MSLAGFVLAIGASLSAVSFPWQPPSPAHLIAEWLGAPLEVRAHAGAKIHQVMPADTEIAQAKVVVAVDSFYWYSNRREDCEIAAQYAERLFAARANRPMVMATVPGEHCINALLREKCVASCVLYEPPPFAGLHPDREYIERAFANIWPRLQRVLGE